MAGGNCLAVAVVVSLSMFCVHCELVHVVTPERVDIANSTTSPGSSISSTVPQFKRETLPSGPVDSYLAALRHSHGASSRFDPPSASPESSYGPGPAAPVEPPYESYNDPKQDNTYGPPQGYHPTKPITYPAPAPPVPYGPPAPMYLPQPPQQPPFYGMPFAAPTDLIGGILKTILPKGIDLETICKLLLKLMIFKLIVKFIAVICILLAAPLFQSKEKPMEEEEDDEDDRRFAGRSLNELTAFVWDSINTSSKRFANSTAQDKDDDFDYDVVEKVAGEIDDKMATPTEEATIRFLSFCVSVANMAVGWMTSMVRRRNNEMDPIEQLLWSLWEYIKRTIYTKMSNGS